MEQEEEPQESLREKSQITEKVDVWAFGCIIQEVLTGIKPWTNKVKSDNKILALLYKKKHFEITNLIPKNTKLRTLIEKCTEIDPVKRISIKEAKSLLLEIMFDHFQSNIYFHHIDFNEFMIKIYQQFENISNVQKYHLFKKVHQYMAEYFREMCHQHHKTLSFFDNHHDHHHGNKSPNSNSPSQTTKSTTSHLHHIQKLRKSLLGSKINNENNSNNKINHPKEINEFLNEAHKIQQKF